MPFKTISVDAPVFFAHKDIVIYHTYVDNDAEQEFYKYQYAFTPDADPDEMNEDCFDIRKLPNWIVPPHPPYASEDGSKENYAAWDEYHKQFPEYVKKTIREALDLNHIKPPNSQ